MSPPQDPGSRDDGAAASHPTAEELVSFADGELAPDSSERLSRHLEGCSECRELVGDLAAYPNLEAPGDSYQIGREELRASLGSLRFRALTEEIGARDSRAELERPAARRPAGASGTAAVPERPRRSPAWRRLAEAAVLVGLLGWGFARQLEVNHLEDDLSSARTRLASMAEQLVRPRANAGVVQLPEIDNPLRSPAPGSVLGPAGLTVVVDPADSLPAGRYSAEIHDRSGVLVRRIDGLEPQPAGLLFYLPPGSLPPGEYSVRLRGGDGAEWPTIWRLALQG